MFGKIKRSRRLIAQIQAALDDGVEAGLFPAGWLVTDRCLALMAGEAGLNGSTLLGLPILRGEPDGRQPYALISVGDPRLTNRARTRAVPHSTPLSLSSPLTA
ncbi:hypothetical protein [Sphingobium olei]|uniref:IclR-ED domain-containing protein n=1 Tax=Sphingobium olei TaxID=420955 RepID=A0ABW3NTI9_9SPHN